MAKILLSYYKTSEDELTALYDDGSTTFHIISKAIDRLKQMKEENEINKDKDPADFILHSTTSLEWDLWLLGKFVIEALPKDIPKDKDYKAIGVFGVIARLG